MATFLTDLMKKGYTQDEIFAVIFESERERKRRRVQAIVIETVAAHRLKKIREFLAYKELATWRRMNGFDRVAHSEENWFHGPCSLPPTPEQFAAGLWCEVNALKDAISMPRQKASNFINAIERGKVSDKEFAILKRLVEKRDREAVQVTVTQVNTVQHSSPCPLDPEPSPSVYVELENAEGKMGPELEELESPSDRSGLKTPGQQCHPNEGTWEQRRTTANGFLTAGVDSSQGGRVPSPTESVDTRADKSTKITADIIILQQGHKLRSEENKQFDPDEEGEKAPPWTRLYSTFFFWGELGRYLSVFLFVLCLCFVCVCFPNYFSIQVTTSQRS